VSTVRLLTSGERGWDSKPIALDGFEGIDVDLRLSAARVTISNAKLGRTAVAANLRGGNLTVAVGESQAFGGVVKGTFALANRRSAQTSKRNCSSLMSSSSNVSARCSGSEGSRAKAISASQSRARAAASYDLTKRLNGTAGLTSRKGAIAGFNVEQLLRRIERRPLSGGGEFRTGKTPYDT